MEYVKHETLPMPQNVSKIGIKYCHDLKAIYGWQL